MRLGTDIIEIQRIAAACERNADFPDKILSDAEKALFDEMPATRQVEFLAGRFSAKEAYAKALGTGLGRLKFKDISILPDALGRPVLQNGPVIEEVLVSISHCRTFATATVIINSKDAIVDHAIRCLK
ncbi:holo-ACP synthase [Tuanshanicoccus lijuaniae]|uniref:holo-ACP synthase n=1 Tax=Aerococcaceae bacterium zg-1292 TaxID=2774330 RepID=UPI001BD88D7C|nr:holo-ACP synthase [Aerococcaceae bacterium zg-BR22]MBS4456945.1 holo-ACP synthase [Aerococcaceae bacterium zg-A91]MBS4458805.1 holo-ACP synthase [Aerococcaceae bacterium zg-BR33]